MADDKRWYEFSLFDVCWSVAVLTILCSIFGPPTTVYGWLLFGPALLAGHGIGHVIRKRRASG